MVDSEPVQNWLALAYGSEDIGCGRSCFRWEVLQDASIEVEPEAGAIAAGHEAHVSTASLLLGLRTQSAPKDELQIQMPVKVARRGPSLLPMPCRQRLMIHYYPKDWRPWMNETFSAGDDGLSRVKRSFEGRPLCFVLCGREVPRAR